MISRKLAKALANYWQGFGNSGAMLSIKVAKHLQCWVKVEAKKSPRLLRLGLSIQRASRLEIYCLSIALSDSVHKVVALPLGQLFLYAAAEFLEVDFNLSALFFRLKRQRFRLFKEG